MDTEVKRGTYLPTYPRLEVGRTLDTKFPAARAPASRVGLACMAGVAEATAVGTHHKRAIPRPAAVASRFHFEFPTARLHRKPRRRRLVPHTSSPSLSAARTHGQDETIRQLPYPGPDGDAVGSLALWAGFESCLCTRRPATNWHPACRVRITQPAPPSSQPSPYAGSDCQAGYGRHTRPAAAMSSGRGAPS